MSHIDNRFEHIYTMLEEIFESSIFEADTSELFSNLNEIYDSFNGQGFEESFESILMYILSDSKRSTDVSKLLRFIAESIVALDNKCKTEAKKNGVKDEDIDDIVHPLLKYLFRALIRWSQANSFTVRFRSCQLLYTILTCIQDNGIGEIDLETYENIGNLLETRRLDVSVNVRAHAVLLSKFFQDPTTVNDPVISALCWQMQHDPNPRVRQNIVSIIAACEETIIPIANRFLFDKHPGVRNAALLHICKRIGPRSFTPAQRILILQNCFTDSSDVVCLNAEQKLIPMWFRACGDKLTNFLKLLRVGTECLDNLPFIKNLVNILLRFVKISQIVEEIDLDMNSCLPNLPLTGEKVFVWRQLFALSNKDQRLKKFIADLENLVPFILNCLDDSSENKVDVHIFAELIIFLMDIMETMGIQKCDEVFPAVLNLMRHPFKPRELMPYLVTLYLTFSPLDKDQVHNEVMSVIEDLQNLMQFTEGQEKNILLKCLAIASQILIEESTLTPGIKSIKDKLIIHHINSEDEEVKSCATSALILYCLLDVKEAKLSWSIFEEAIQMENTSFRNTLLEGVFDILQCHGGEIFGDFTNNGQEKLDEFLIDAIKCYENQEEGNETVLKGILKLYLANKASSPLILANASLLYFHPDEYTSAQYELEKFFPVFGQTKGGCDCIVQSFLTIIDLLFDASKKSFLSEINIKKVAETLLEFSKEFEKQNGYKEEKFQDLLAILLCKRFIKKPWRLSAADLYSVCSHIIPEKFDTLLNLKELVLQISESLQSSIFQKKNPYAKKSVKNFSSYLKKIQQALNKAPLFENNNKEKIGDSSKKRLDYDTSSSSIQDEPNIQVDSSDDEDSSSPMVDSDLLALKKKDSCKTLTFSDAETPSKLTEETPRKIATRNRLSRKTPSTAAKETKNTFKTPGPQKSRARKLQLEIALTKTC